jgi:hypothetical protein
LPEFFRSAIKIISKGAYVDDSLPIDFDALERPNNYSGLWECRWPNGELKYRGQFESGVEIGPHVRYFENGVVAQVQWYDSTGCPRGTTLNFYPDGDKCSEECCDDPERRSGTFVRRDYDSSGEVTRRTEYREFEIIESWERPDQQLDPETEIEIDRIVADAVQELTRRLEGATDDDDDDEEGNSGTAG